jgi:hypothetical protein
VGRNESEELQEYSVLNPMNVIVSKGTASRAGDVMGPDNQPIPIIEEVTVLRIGGIPLLSVEKYEDVLKKSEVL